MNRDLLKADLIRDEHLMLHAYDDATGLLLHPGYLLQGHPSIGVGRALDTNGITHVESMILLDDDLDVVIPGVRRALPWFVGLDEVRQRILCNMAFNMGIQGMLGFTKMLAAIRAGDHNTAAKEMLKSKWANQTGERAERLSRLMLT